MCHSSCVMHHASIIMCNASCILHYQKVKGERVKSSKVKRSLGVCVLVLFSLPELLTIRACSFLGCSHFWGRIKFFLTSSLFRASLFFGAVFIFGVIFIFEVILILRLSLFLWRLHFWDHYQKMTTPSRKLRHTAEASLTVLTTEKSGGINKFV